MKKFTKVCLIIAAVLGGVGLLLCGIASAMGGYSAIHQLADAGELNHGQWHIDNHGIHYGMDEDDWEADEKKDADTQGYIAEDNGAGEPVDGDGVAYTYDTGEITNLDIDIEAADVLFAEGERQDAIVVTLYNCKNSCYAGKVQGDTLHIEYRIENKIYNESTNMKLVIAIPTGMDFEDIDIDMGAANATFELADVSCNTLCMDVGAANVEVDEFHVKELLDVSVGAGNLVIDDGSYKNIKIFCGMGGVEMQGAVSGDVNAECGMGDMNIRLEGNPEAYNYNLSCGMGDMSVNGVEYSGIAGEHQIKNDGATGTVDVDCGMGSVDFTIE